MPARQNILREHLKLRRISERDWEFEYTRVGMKALGELDHGIDLWRSADYVRSERVYRSLIRRFPEFVDAHHHLAMLRDALGEKEEALRIWSGIVWDSTGIFPADFYSGRDRLPWSCLENRPFLRACHGLGLCYLSLDAADKASVLFANMLDLNPNDNQGIRDLAVLCALTLRRPRDVLRISRRYAGDTMECVLCGLPLALFQLQKEDRARIAMNRAIRTYPLIAAELLKSRSVKPRNLDESQVALGGSDQAYLYREAFYAFWKQTPGALDFSRECTMASQQPSPHQ